MQLRLLRRFTCKQATMTIVGTEICIFLCGDVMTGRGIDQVLPHPVNPALYEPYVHDARDYVQLAEAANGPILRPVDFAYIWGDALEELQRAGTDVRIINLETSITCNEKPWPEKGINYRMNPKNVGCITAACIDCCCLANNHVLDWEYQGLAETRDVGRRFVPRGSGAQHCTSCGSGCARCGG